VEKTSFYIPSESSEPPRKVYKQDSIQVVSNKI
jgi:hypothetical protein